VAYETVGDIAKRDMDVAVGKLGLEGLAGGKTQAS